VVAKARLKSVSGAVALVYELDGIREGVYQGDCAILGNVR